LADVLEEGARKQTPTLMYILGTVVSPVQAERPPSSGEMTALIPSHKYRYSFIVAFPMPNQADVAPSVQPAYSSHLRPRCSSREMPGKVFYHVAASYPDKLINTCSEYPLSRVITRRYM
jgi:hypothetical protein